MDISSVGGMAANMAAPAAAERLERGPDRDNDGDEGGKAAPVTLSKPPPGRGEKVDMLA